ncbi:cupredoxin family protein [Aquisalimonas lutea]|uniref:cupredoxin domain-containing protein n=1 Tax=Aquisalimonas lutea TaxID=1327750 RepID=UPI0025B40A1C|nr:cupredoxin family protein [Aquisalimonas lutea]MDN3519047.1 cupredoxin family protein [Aquisalimonas lutea]
MTVKHVLAATLLAAATAATAGPSGESHSHSHGNMAGGQPGKPDAVDRTIRIDAADIEFDRQKIEVEAGETIRFVITNTGQLDHDFTLGTPAMQRAHQEEMREMMAEGGMQGHDDPNAVMLEPGQTKELIWRFAEADELEFACNVPGHYEAGMRGEIVFDG